MAFLPIEKVIQPPQIIHLDSLFILRKMNVIFLPNQYYINSRFCITGFVHELVNA